MYGKINSTSLGFSSDSAATGVNFFLDEESNINSVALVTPVDFDSASEGDGSGLPTVWKVFSQTPLSEAELDWLFEERAEIRVADWLAYPHYQVPGRALLGDFLLSKGLYHVNAMEWAASAMECSALAGRNVANHIVRVEAGRQEKEREEDEEEGSFFKDEL